jgi:hypothetical protein
MGSPCGCARSTDATCSCSGEAARTSPSASTRSGSRQAPRVPVELPRFKHTSDVFATPACVRCNPGRTRGPSSDRRRSGASRRGNAHARSSLNFGRPTVMVRRWCRRSGRCDGGSQRLAGSKQRNRPRPGKRDAACAFHRSTSALASERSHAEGCKTRSSPGSIHGRTILERRETNRAIDQVRRPAGPLGVETRTSRSINIDAQVRSSAIAGSSPAPSWVSA